MSVAELGRFFAHCATSPDVIARYEKMALPDLIFAARCEGFSLEARDFGTLIGGMEVWRSTVADHQAIDAKSRLWRAMWGRSRLDYVVRELWEGMDPAARAALVAETAHD